MNNVVGVCVGVGAFAAGVGVAAFAAADYVRGIDNKFVGIAKGLNYIQENIDLTVPEELAEQLVKVSAQEIADKEVKKATEAACKEINKDIKNLVKGNVQNAYAGVEESVRQKLEHEINLQTIEKIENKVAEKIAKQMLNKYTTQNVPTNKSDLAKTLIQNGVPSWEISNILNAVD